MAQTIELDDITIDVVKKNIKNINLKVYAPTGRVRISAPSRMSLDAIRAFAMSKMGWIKKQQMKLREQEKLRGHADQENHYVWGKRYLPTIIEGGRTPTVELVDNRMVLILRSGTTARKRQAIVEGWYREELKKAIPPLIEKWESRMGVSLERVHVRRMKTRWGSCTPAARSIRLNTELIKKPRKCLEYVIVHELVHLLEPTHNARFAALMDHFMPQWRSYRQQLNQFPVCR